MLLADVIQRDTRANQPAATTVATGTLYHVTDEAITERSSGSAWQSFDDSGSVPAGAGTHVIGIVLDGGGADITTGVKGFVSAPFAGTITGARLLSIDAASTAGSIVIDVWKDTYANYPPVNADSITASAPPTLSSAAKSNDTTLTGWTTSVSAGDVFGFNVDSCTGITKCILQLTVEN